ncbi:MAG: hypothetical protein ACK6D4_06420, partial [Planctomyces sp.]
LIAGRQVADPWRLSNSNTIAGIHVCTDNADRVVECRRSSEEVEWSQRSVAKTPRFAGLCR